MLKHSFEREKEEKKKKRKSINPITFETLFPYHDGYKLFFPTLKCLLYRQQNLSYSMLNNTLTATKHVLSELLSQRK
jgi:hypothetical protein